MELFVIFFMIVVPSFCFGAVWGISRAESVMLEVMQELDDDASKAKVLIAMLSKEGKLDLKQGPSDKMLDMFGTRICKVLKDATSKEEAIKLLREIQ